MSIQARTRCRLPHAFPLLLVLLACAGCNGNKGPGTRIADPDQALFADTVYPVLLRDCAFPACHGEPNRFFRVFGPGRNRIEPGLLPLDPATTDEIALAYERARSNINPDDPKNSLLLRKPLDAAAGGAGHEGVDLYGRDVYTSVDDPNYAILLDWVLTTPVPVAGVSSTTPNPGASP